MTAPDRRQRVHTLRRLVPPPTWARTFCRLGSHLVLVLLWAWLTLFPTMGFLPHMSHTLLTCSSPWDKFSILKRELRRCECSVFKILQKINMTHFVFYFKLFCSGAGSNPSIYDRPGAGAGETGACGRKSHAFPEVRRGRVEVTKNRFQRIRPVPEGRERRNGFSNDPAGAW